MVTVGTIKFSFVIFGVTKLVLWNDDVHAGFCGSLCSCFFL